MVKFKASLCKLHRGNPVHYSQTTIEAMSLSEAIESAKGWTSSVKQHEGSEFRIYLASKIAATLKAGEF